MQAYIDYIQQCGHMFSVH